MFASLIYPRVLETGVDSTGQQNKTQNRNEVGFAVRKKRKKWLPSATKFCLWLLYFSTGTVKMTRWMEEGFNLPNQSRVVLFTFRCPRPPSWALLLTSKSPTVSMWRQRQTHSQTLGGVGESYRRGGERSVGARRVKDTKGGIIQSTNLGS